MIPGQYQIGDLVFGRGTVYPVSSVEFQSYNIQAQDAQLIRSDDIQFGFDQIQPGAIIFEMSVLNFNAIPNMQSLSGPKAFTATPHSDLTTLAQTWRGDAVRGSWGEVVPLRSCERDGRILVYYGRPRKFQANKSSWRSCYYNVSAEFQRADAMTYEDFEYYAALPKNSLSYLNRTVAQANSWVRLVGIGPMTQPTITVGSHQIILNMTISSGQVFEINSYPWSRRAILSNGTNISSNIIGFLDQLVLLSGTSNAVGWSASSSGGSIAIYWRDAYSG